MVLIPNDLRWAITGFNNFEKIRGELVKPNGRTWKQNLLPSISKDVNLLLSSCNEIKLKADFKSMLTR